jgi:hypothetical protein
VPSQGNLLGLPPPIPLFDASIENVLDATKITVTRVCTVAEIGGWISGNASGANPNQPGRFVLYTHDVANDRPLNFITRTVEGLVTGATPQEVCVRLPCEGALQTIQPGTYWVGVHVGQAAGTGEWRIHGGPNAAFRGIKNTGVVYPNTPAVWPAGGTIFAASGAALGFTFIQQPTVLDVKVVGQFLVGTQTVKDPNNLHFNQPTLILRGHRFEILIAGSIEIVHMGRPTLILRGKATSSSTSGIATMQASKLILRGKPVSGGGIPGVKVGCSVLYLNGVTFSLSVHGIADVNTGILLLLGMATTGRIPGLVPTLPEDILLVPTFPVLTVSPPPTEAEDLILVPTTPVSV